MGFSAKVIADSIGPSGCRITSMEVTYPLSVHQDHLRHRVFSFSVASNRAIPTRDYIARVIKEPATPVRWGANQAGMIARQELKGWRRALVSWVWTFARWPAVVLAWVCWKLGAHKEIVNWLLMPWAWTTMVVTGTDWSNFFALRTHPDARWELQKLAKMMLEAYNASTPNPLQEGDWHLPYLTDLERGLLGPEGGKANALPLCRVSAARCARVSLLRHEERRAIPLEMAKADELQSNGHMSPFEHQAQALRTPEKVANLRGFRPYRSTIPNEHDFGLILAAREREQKAA